MHNNTNSNNNINVYFKNDPEFTHSYTLNNGNPQNAVSGKAWKKHTTKQSLLGILNQNVTD